MSPLDDALAAAHLWELSELVDEAVITTDAQGVITGMNSAAERLFERPMASALGRSIAEIYTVEAVDDEDELQARLKENGVIRHFGTSARRADGSCLPVFVSARQVRTADGSIAGTVRCLIAANRNEPVDRAARRLSAIVESSDDAIVSKDLNGTVMTWNTAAQRMFGYTPEEIVGRSIRLIIPSERQPEEDYVLNCIRSGRSVEHFDTVRVRKDGTLVPISLTVSPIRDQFGRVIGASKIARDISDRRRIELERDQSLAAARESATLTEKLNRVGSVVASTLDRHSVVQEVTNAATELTGAEFGAFFYNVSTEGGEGYTLSAIAGVPREAFSRFPMPGNTAVFRPTSVAEGVVRSDDITMDPGYGHNAPYHGVAAGHLPVRSYLAVPVKAASGEILGGLIFGHSQSGRFSEAHERLAVGIGNWASIALENARLYVGLQHANQLKDEFLATLSHELRTPLNAILGYASMLRRGAVPPERRQHALDTVERNASALAQIVSDVLDISRIVSGKMQLQLRPVDLHDISDAAVATMAPAAEAKGVTLDVAAAHVIVRADGDRLQQVLWNLLSNAVKFTPPGGRVTVRVVREEGRAIMSVADTGIGIPGWFLPHVFERFRQAEIGPRRERGGLGLGLSISRQLIELHGGTIDAASDGVGTGATFILTLPIAQDSDSQTLP
jgi:PAS domain S-box-containing protein